MTKRKIHRTIKQLKPISPWYFLAIAVLSGAICVISLRSNNLQALKLRDQVVATDKENGDIETSLRNLRVYMYSHMNTSLSTGSASIKPPIQLKYRYERLVAAQNAQVGSHNTNVAIEAQSYCEKQFPKGLSGGGRVPCIKNYVLTNGIKEVPIPDSLYKFDFVSPLWSPDIAGWSFVISVIASTLFVLRIGLDKWLKAELND